MNETREEGGCLWLLGDRGGGRGVSEEAGCCTSARTSTTAALGVQVGTSSRGFSENAAFL